MRSRRIIDEMIKTIAIKNTPESPSEYCNSIRKFPSIPFPGRLKKNVPIGPNSNTTQARLSNRKLITFFALIHCKSPKSKSSNAL